MLLTSTAFASDEMFKINNVSVDTSGSTIFINTLGAYTNNITDGIKLVKLPKENKIYFDINSSVLLTKKQNQFFTSGSLKELKIAQFSIEPNIVRVVMIFHHNYDLDNLKIGNINNQIVILTNELSYEYNSYFQKAFVDKFNPDYSYYNLLTIQSLIPSVKTQILDLSKTYTPQELNQINLAFNNSIGKQAMELVETEQSQSIKLRSKYYITSVSSKNGGILMSGYGVPTLRKPFFLADPNRMVFDIVNSNIEPNLNNTEIPIDPKCPKEGTIKIGRFEKNITRFVVTSDNAAKYIPVFSSDSQSMLFINSDKLDVSKIISKKTNIIKSKYNKNPTNDEIEIEFDNPVIWGMRRSSEDLFIYFFNAAQYNESIFKQETFKTPYQNSTISLLNNIGIKYAVPLTASDEVNVDFSADGKSFRIKKLVYRPPITHIKEYAAYRHKAVGEKIVIDAGHGGSDYGAIRLDVNEKDINLDVAKRVEDILTRRGYVVKMTRTRDKYLSLEERCEFTDSVKPELFVSIHVNSSVGTAPNGIETHYYHENSKELANTIHHKMIRAVRANDRGLFKSKFYVINHTSVPAVLLEIGFLSNEAERAQLVTTRRKQATAQAIADGIIEYIKKH